MTENATYAWTPEKQIHYPLITEVALSPDGTRVVYAAAAPVPAGGLLMWGSGER